MVKPAAYPEALSRPDPVCLSPAMPRLLFAARTPGSSIPEAAGL